MATTPAQSESDTNRPLVAVAQGNSAARTNLLRGLEQERLACRPFRSGGDLLESLEAEMPDCIVLDIDIPETGGLAILQALPPETLAVPVIMLVPGGAYSLAAEAMRAGAADFVEKPVSLDQLAQKIAEQIARSAGLRRQASEIERCKALTALLTPRENEIAALVVAGRSNKEIGIALGISPRTVEVHRAHIFKKLGVRNAVEFALVFEKAKFLPQKLR